MRCLANLLILPEVVLCHLRLLLLKIQRIYVLRIKHRFGKIHCASPFICFNNILALFHILWAPFLLKSNNFCKNLTSLFAKIFFYGRRDKYFWKAYERQKASRSYNLEAFWLPRGIRTFPALRLVGRPNGNLCSALPHAELFNAWMLKANRLRWPSRIRLKIYIRIAWIFLPLSRNVIHYC